MRLFVEFLYFDTNFKCVSKKLYKYAILIFIEENIQVKCGPYSVADQKHSFAFRRGVAC